jgi:hypothetical protein
MAGVRNPIALLAAPVLAASVSAESAETSPESASPQELIHLNTRRFQNRAEVL